MTAPATSMANIRWRGLVSAISCISVVGIAESLTIPLLSLDLERRGISAIVIGWQVAGQAVGGILAALVMPYLLSTVPPRRLILAAIIVSAMIVLNFPYVSIDAWFLMRLVFGACITVIFVVSEYWITRLADEHRRGLISAIYATCLAVGFALGPVVLAVFGWSSPLPYALGALILCVGLAPVLLGGGDVPAAPPNLDAGLFPILRIVANSNPIAILAAFFFGAIENAVLSFMAIWGLRSGLQEHEAALLLTAIFLGNILLQVPLGILADRLQKRGVLLICSLVGAAGAVFVPMLIGNMTALVSLLFLWGGIIAGLYSIGLAYLADQYRESDLPSANAAFVLNYSLGMLIGPWIAGAALDWWNPNGFVIVLGVFAGIYSAVVAAHMARRS